MVTMTCMTTKQKFEVEDPPVVVLRNGRFAYRCECPWKGKTGKVLYAYKFCSADAYLKWSTRYFEKAEEEPEEVDQEEVPEDEFSDSH